MRDEVLAERSRRGSGMAFAALVERHCEAVYRIAQNICTSAGATEEVIRQTFIAAYYDAPSRPKDASFRTWLYGIALRKALRQRRSALHMPAASLERFMPRFDAEGVFQSPAMPWPEEDTGSDLAGFLRDALDCMDEDARAALVLCDLVDLPVEEAAALLQVPGEIVRHRLHRARLMVRGLLDRRFRV